MLKNLYCPHKKVVSELAINFIHGQIYLHTQFSPKPWSPGWVGVQSFWGEYINHLFQTPNSTNTWGSIAPASVDLYLYTFHTVFKNTNYLRASDIYVTWSILMVIFWYTQVRDFETINKLLTFNKSPLIIFFYIF